MPIIAARRYAQGSPCDYALSLDSAERLPPGLGEFDWIGIADPTVEEMNRIGQMFGLPPLAVEDALSPIQMPKVETYGSTLFVVARTAALEEGEVIAYGQTAVFLSSDFVITVRLGSTRSHLALRRQLEHSSERLAEGPDYVLHAVLDYIVDGFIPIVEKLEVAAQAIEERAIDVFPDRQTIRRIFRLRRQLRRFQRVIGPMETVCARLAETELPNVNSAARVWFRDVQDHVRRVMRRIEGLKETLATVVETASLLEQHRQGDVTRQLAAWAAILAVPTAIAGIYGMNFEFMPELRWQYGYFLVWGIIISVCGGLWLQFRRIGWL